MAFKMNKPIMKGSVLHKKLKSAAQYKTAKEMSKLFPLGENRLSSDTGLTQASEILGKSYIPHAMDYGVDTKIGDIEGVGVEEGKKVKPTKVIKIEPKEIKMMEVDKGEYKPTKATFKEEKKLVRENLVTIEDIRKANEDARKTGIVKAIMTEIEMKAEEKRKEEEKKEEKKEEQIKKKEEEKTITKKKKKKKKKKEGDGTMLGRWLKKTFSKK